jgi:hypothetical protein
MTPRFSPAAYASPAASRNILQVVLYAPPV